MFIFHRPTDPQNTSLKPRHTWRAISSMIFDMKSLCFAVLLALLPLSALPGRSRLFAAELKSSDTDWSKTLEVAKKEGKVGVFLFQREKIETAVKAFEKKFPDIEVVTASTPAAETGPRLMAERRAGKFLWDVCLCGPTTPLAVLYPAKALDPIKPALLLPEVTDMTRWWEGKHQ